MAEDYSRARKLVTIEHLGAQFHVVRRRFNGKPWRQYLTLIQDGFEVAAASWDRAGTDPTAAAKFFKERLERGFPNPEDRERMFSLIAELKTKDTP